MARVFFVQKADRFDTSAASEYGEKLYLVSPHVSAFNVDAFVQSMLRSLGEYKFDPATDYIALTGQTICVAFMVGVLLATYGRLRVLLFDARVGKYQERILEKPPLEVIA